MNFYCTAGRGTEPFLEKELKYVFQSNLTQVKVTDGKIFFKLSGDQDEAQKVLQLKTAERAFVQVCHIKTDNLDHRNLMYSIKNNLNDKEVWKDTLAVLQSVKQYLDKGDNSGGDEKRMCTSVPESITEPECKRPKIDLDDTDKDVSFRVNFKCPACFRKRLNIKLVPKQIGLHIKQLMGWKVELRNPVVEICIQLNGDFLTVGLPLTREPLSKRSFIKLIGLRSTVAHIMTELLNIKTGDTVLDPMCGKATILLEAANCHMDVKYIGIDKSESQLGMAKENCQFARSSNIQLIHGDALALPFQDSSIEKIVTDAPFGFNHTTDMPLEDFYRNILQEFSRVLTSRGRIVILTSSAMNNFINRICSEQSDSSKAYRKDAVEGNSVEKTNKKIGENGLDCGLINNTVTENLSELTDDKDKVDITDDKCESMRTNKIAVSHEAFPALDSSEKISNKKATDIVQDSDDSSHNLIINLSGSSDKTESEVIKTDHVYGTEPKRPENETKINGLIFLESNYVKLGETHAYICVLEKSAVT